MTRSPSSGVGVDACEVTATELFTGFTRHDLTDRPLLMSPEALAQRPLENLPGAALGELLR